MSPVRSRESAPVLVLPAARLAVLGFALIAAGCAANKSPYPGDRLAGPMPPPDRQSAWSARVEIEDDGLPAQLAPRYRRPEPDDPREPWSPNYGTVRPGEPVPEPAPVPPPAPGPRRLAGAEGGPSSFSVPWFQAPPSRRREAALTRLSEADEEAVIRRAIAEHEMRRPD
jgi:hypothetical protein